MLLHLPSRQPGRRRYPWGPGRHSLNISLEGPHRECQRLGGSAEPVSATQPFLRNVHQSDLWLMFGNHRQCPALEDADDLATGWVALPFPGGCSQPLPRLAGWQPSRRPWAAPCCSSTSSGPQTQGLWEFIEDYLLGGPCPVSNYINFSCCLQLPMIAFEVT